MEQAGPSRNASDAYAYILVSSTVLWVHEYLITLDEEVHFMWSRRISFGGVLFFANRYLPFFGTNIFFYIVFAQNSEEDTNVCYRGYIALACLVYFNFLLAHAVLLTRAYAVWKSQKVVHAVLATTYLIIVGGSAYILYLFVRGVIPLQLSQSHRGCVLAFSDDILWIDCVILIAAETFAKSIINCRNAHFINGLLDVMVKDGVGYFACILAITIANVVVLRGASRLIQDSLLPLQAILQGILCNRLLFHVHIVNEERTRPWTSEGGCVLVDLRAVKALNIRR